MENRNKGWCILIGILGYVFGVLLAVTMVLIPVAIYCFIGARRYMQFSELTDVELATKKLALKRWAIFFSIIAFPFGMFAIIPALRVGDNDVVVTNIKGSENVTVVTNVEQEPVKREVEAEEKPLSDEETIEKLQKLKEEGLITEEEFERAKREILGLD